MINQYEMDEDNNFIRKTDGICSSCGDWTDYRIKHYGLYICTKCYKEAENLTEDE